MSLTRATRLAFAALVATIAMGAAASAAGAASGMSITNGVTLASANGSLTFTVSVNIICDVTLGFRLSPVFLKVAGASEIARVLLTNSGSSIANCNLGATGIVLNDMTVEYAAHAGTLPNITSISGTSDNSAFLLMIPSIGNCLLDIGTITYRFNRNTTTRAIDTIGVDATSLISIGPGANCGRLPNATIRGTLTVLATKPLVQLI